MAEEHDDLKPRSSLHRCTAFHTELNSFICNRSEEWDVNEYELVGILLVELFEQLDWVLKGDTDLDEDEDEEDEEDEE